MLSAFITITPGQLEPLSSVFAFFVFPRGDRGSMEAPGEGSMLLSPVESPTQGWNWGLDAGGCERLPSDWVHTRQQLDILGHKHVVHDSPAPHGFFPRFPFLGEGELCKESKALCFSNFKGPKR